MASDDVPPARRRAAWSPGRRGIALIALLVVAPALMAQSGRAIALRIKPHVGDTLYTRFEQHVEMVGTTRVGDADTTMRMTSTMIMLSHVLVRGSDETGTIVTTITDSVSLVAEGSGAATPPESARKAMQGRRVQLHIAPDGSATVLDAPDEFAPDVRAVVSGMPSTLPDRPVPVGGTWEKRMAIPVGGRAGGAHAATLRALYRLDSLSADGDIAYISMRGTLTRDSTAVLPSHVRITSTGSITGNMRVDRRSGWWSDSFATIALTSFLTPTTLTPSMQPVRVETKITQHMQTGRAP